MSDATHVLVDTDDSPNAAGFCAHCGERMVFKYRVDGDKLLRALLADR